MIAHRFRHWQQLLTPTRHNIKFLRSLVPMKNKVLIVGCGGIGRRHLQALLKESGKYDLIVVDKTVSKLELHTFVSQHCGGASPPKIYSNIEQVLETDFFAIVLATTSSNRMSLLQEILANKTAEFVICEKPISNTLEDLRIAKSFDHVPIYINHHRRYQNVYRSLQASHSNKLKRMEFRSTGLGLLCNFAHHLDTAVMLNSEAGDILDVQLTIDELTGTSQWV